MDFSIHKYEMLLTSYAWQRLILDIRKNAENGDFSYPLILEKRGKLENFTPFFLVFSFPRGPRFLSNLPPFPRIFVRAWYQFMMGVPPPSGQ